MLLFQKNKKDEWLFVGWAANSTKNNQTKHTTMGNIGIGTARIELESAYEIYVSKTTL